MWHASVGLGGRPLTEWSTGALRRAHALCERLLEGVGTGETGIKAEGRALHHRRRLNEKETALLSPEWLAIAAVDEE